jgi:hypothetical protein
MRAMPAAMTAILVVPGTQEYWPAKTDDSRSVKLTSSYVRGYWRIMHPYTG